MPQGLHNELKLYEIDAFLSWIKTLLPMSSGLNERVSEQMSAVEQCGAVRSKQLSKWHKQTNKQMSE